MKFLKTGLEDAYLVELEKRGDDRGFFARSFCVDEFSNAGLETDFVQQNMSRSSNLHTLRGMHYQVGAFAETKYIRCHKGAILDVIVDIRRDSPTFLSHESFELTEENFKALYVPKGFAHGFITLTKEVVVSYLVSSRYSFENERAIRWNDPLLKIKWPSDHPVLSEKDATHTDFDPDMKSLNEDYLEA
jgi:dTDP-4-dehydrorhamnose 3,5-epimerase